MPKRRLTSPAKNLPATNKGMSIEIVCKMTPNVKTPVLNIIAHRRPSVSARGADRRAPKKVPADRMDTISDV